MKNYLSLSNIQARVHRRQNRMTIFCIALSVFLVTGVFSMADMEVRNQTERAKIDHRNWHVVIHDVPEDEIEEILNEAGVEVSSRYDVVNYNLDKGYSILGKPAAICGVEASFEDIAVVHRNAEGSFPASDNQIEITENMQRQFNLSVGDSICISTSAGSFDYYISGFVDDTTGLLKTDACGVFMTCAAFDEFCRANGEDQHPAYYIRFRDSYGIRRTISQLKESHGTENISENTAVLGIIGMSSSDYIVGLYATAAVLMLLVILAGVLMISGSMNSSIAERTRYFGMLRCIGAGKGQIRHLVRREALNQCITAIPLGEAAAVAGVWIICSVLHYGIGGEWALFPVFKISVTGILTGAAIGIITVLLAADAPARKAAGVSPIEAVSANGFGSLHSDSRTVSGKIRIDSALGMNHALSSRKGIILMTGSFALSILLFLSFSVMIDWIGHALNTTKPYSQDMTVYCDGYERTLPKELAQRISDIPGIKCAYGRMYACTRAESDTYTGNVDLISYEHLQFGWAEKELLSGDIDAVSAGNGIMTVFEPSNPLALGDTVTINGNDVRIGAVLSDSPFSPDGTPIIICSEETFSALTGKDGYALVDMLVAKCSDEETVQAVRALLDDDVRLSDVRKGKQEVNNTYLAFSILVYGFLAIVAMITVVNIVNSISMSVSARRRQYGIMRALGTDDRQIRRMISSESLTYAVSGCIAGCALGLPLNAFFFKSVIGNYWGDSWRLPAAELAIILIVVLFSAAAATVKPAKQITDMTVIDSIYSQ